MRLTDILVMRGMASAAGLATAVARQRLEGGRLGDNLIALGLITAEELFAVVASTPPLPLTVAETGVSPSLLRGLLLKMMRDAGCETIPELAARLHLAPSVVRELIDSAVAQKLVHVLGATAGGIVHGLRYALGDDGRVAAGEAMERTRYMGPAPVSLAAFQAQIAAQPISGERLDEPALRAALAGLVLSDHTIRRLLPAVSAGRSVLLHGPPGNGKTSLAGRIATLFTDPVFIPYAVEVAGQVIRMHDPSLHLPMLPQPVLHQPVLPPDAAPPAALQAAGVQIEAFDARWAACRRPVAMAGGEMTLDMLELRWDPATRTYDAPLHIKALNGVFLIDDFGRQKVDPSDLLNRWIVPLESRVDYLKLNTGVTFRLPFDELVIFSTNLDPAALMDPAFLRRIPYKIHMKGPDLRAYRVIFERAAAAAGLVLHDDAFDVVVARLSQGVYHGLAAFQPQFICDQATQMVRCFGLEPALTCALAADALENLYVDAVQAANTATSDHDDQHQG